MSAKRPTIVLVIAIAAIALLEGLAIYRGLDGKFFGLALSAIAGIAGFSLSELIFYRQQSAELRAGKARDDVC